MPRIAAYGSWRSPIGAELAAAGGVELRHGLGQCAADGEDLYWVEGRTEGGGRNVLVRSGCEPTPADVLPVGFSPRTRVHEYGGGDFTVADGTVFFANESDQRLYRWVVGAPPVALTPEGSARYADAVVDGRRRQVICVREEHASGEPANALVAVDARGGEVRTLRAGDDFYAAPRLSPDGGRLCWLAWNHPNMPWDGSLLWVADVMGGSLARAQAVAGGPDESIFQPEWSPQGVLHFVSDRNGWWNLYRWKDGTVEPLCEMAADFGVPQWSLGASTYAFASSQRIVCAFTQRGIWHLGSLDAAGHLQRFEIPDTDIAHVRAVPGRIVFRGGSPHEAACIVSLDLLTGVRRVLRQSRPLSIDPAYLSSPEAIEFPTDGGQLAHGFYYAPANRDFAGPGGERPPLLVLSHGGPTAAAATSLDPKLQFWTSRGIAVLDVNYRGSSGYGRAYRRQLDGAWGIADVADCVNGARFLHERGRVDGRRLLMRGSSAGGFTTLCALTFHNLFRAGASYYGISDLEALTGDTHKFESHYLDRLVGPYPACRDTYRRRSPIHHTDRLSCPVILFQGLDDPIVPPSQAERLVAALRAKGLPVAYLAFAGESHGFRSADNTRRALHAELYFYSRVLGFELADPVEPVVIENL